MVVTFTEEVEREYLRMGQDEEFINGLVALRRQLVEHVSSTKSQNKVGPHVAEAPSAIHQHYYTSEAAYDFATELDLSMLDDAWPSVWTNDLDGFYMDDPDQDMNI
ncbi:hypothetical protein A1O3_08630 [Capronia epimyces CBS 606.96]|uniref:Uncharacterized protein n=1 Tax=Capronia epimyces CBS 606.96 TaxID=1182542 RepID=W9Y9R2_9EURO|nr:uncharacterized protein A1O3_08630 [Capronia epimyces CBS 606.96]EXJ79129.1 hypothetical protein A1O3_08630 [Capronia epimyces CBS 606.96]